jgi:membrane-bound serine protease (ClpP class)
MTDRVRQVCQVAARSLLAAGTVLFLLALPAAAIGPGSLGPGSGPVVMVLHATGVVDGAMAGYIAGGVASAGDQGLTAVVVKLDTPGGSLDAMNQITTALLESKVPVIVWVAPAGGKAASAGTFITLAGNLAFMASGTSIGAASPVDSSGGDITGTEGLKVRNYAISAITAIAEARGRPVNWAVDAVANARASSAEEAVSLKVVDGIADTLADVLAAADGRTVTVAGGATLTLALQGAQPAVIQEAPMNPALSLFHLLSDPNIAFVLFVIGLGGLLLEFINPSIVAGITGSICLVLAFIGFGSLPLNVGGLVLVAIGLVLFVLETQITSHGLLTLGGIVAFVLGAGAVYTRPMDATSPLVQVAWPVTAVVALTMAALMAGVAWVAVRVRTMPAPTGGVSAHMVPGVAGVVEAPINPLGTVLLASEAWSARSADGSPLARGCRVRLVHLDGLTAVVTPETADLAGPPLGEES